MHYFVFTFEHFFQENHNELLSPLFTFECVVVNEMMDKFAFWFFKNNVKVMLCLFSTSLTLFKTQTHGTHDSFGSVVTGPVLWGTPQVQAESLPNTFYQYRSNCSVCSLLMFSISLHKYNKTKGIDIIRQTTPLSLLII